MGSSDQAAWRVASLPMSPAPINAQIFDLAESRLRRAARVRAASRVKQQFLWSWPSGQLLARGIPLARGQFLFIERQVPLTRRR